MTDHIIQNAYYVTDIDSGIERFHQLWGLGPFLFGAISVWTMSPIVARPRNWIFLRHTRSRAI